LHRNRETLGPRELAAVIHPVFQRRTDDEFKCHPVNAALIAVAEYRDDIRMRQTLRQLRFTFETANVFRILARLTRQHFDRCWRTVAQALRFIHRCMRAGAKSLH
jgi:hypothetical protein